MRSSHASILFEEARRSLKLCVPGVLDALRDHNPIKSRRCEEALELQELVMLCSNARSLKDSAALVCVVAQLWALRFKVSRDLETPALLEPSSVLVSDI